MSPTRLQTVSKRSEQERERQRAERARGEEEREEVNFDDRSMSVRWGEGDQFHKHPN